MVKCLSSPYQPQGATMNTAVTYIALTLLLVWTLALATFAAFNDEFFQIYARFIT
jgi:hypothetical protein